MMFQGCFIEVARAVEESFKGAEQSISRVLQGSFKGVSRKFEVVFIFKVVFMVCHIHERA